MPSKRIASLDFVRMLAIVFVLISHGRHLLAYDFNVQWMKFGGFTGVELFFALSGFLIGQVLLRRDFSIKKFLIRRWLRTLPNYYLFLVVNLFLVGGFSFNYLFFAQNLYSPMGDFFPESWSLATEEWFYLLIAMLIWFLGLSNFRLLIYTTGFIVLGVFLYRAWYVAVYDPLWDSGVRKVVFLHIDSLFIGVFISLLSGFTGWRPKNGCVIFFLVLFFFLSWVSCMSQHYLDNSYLARVLMFPLMALSCSILVCYSVEYALKPRLLVFLSNFFSKIAYSLYLVNIPVLLFFLELRAKTQISAFLLYFLFWLVCILFSCLLYRYYELPFLKAKDLV
jgi:peptidoglycan/LPS O-acetylase OafA/YrhL